MPIDLSASDRAKFAAARRAADEVQDGMKVGLGTGSTAAWLVRCLGKRVREEGLRIEAVPTSSRTAALAQEMGITVSALDDVGWLDLTIDGADEFDPAFNLIKGGGGALLQEKIVASASDRMVVITDASKDVAQLGAFPLPVEVVRFGWQSTQRHIATCLESFDVGARACRIRMADGAAYVTDEQHYILDLDLGRIGDAPALCAALNQLPGVVDNGLFIGICDTVILGHEDATVEVRAQGETQAVRAQIVIDPEDSVFAGLTG